jgi:2,5-diketo-D-gluconate reductase A
VTTAPALPLHDGRSLPQLGLGVYKVADDAAAALVDGALRLGYRHIDTAKLYGNERGVGEGVRRSDVPRDDLFITTKLWDDDHGHDATLRAFDASLDRLGLDYVDLYLIHWPVPSRDLYRESWRAMTRLREEGRARSIGVSNFHPHHLARLAEDSPVVPVLNQVELHPWLPQREVRDYDDAHGIVTQSWSPLARGRAIDDPTVAALAARHGSSPAQIVLRWHLDLGLAVIPKSNSLERVAQNLGALDVELDAADHAALAGLETGGRTGQDPDRH